MFKRYRIKPYQRGLVFREDALAAVLRPGTTWRFDPLLRERVEIASVREVWLTSDKLDVIARSGLLGEEAVVLHLTDTQRALVWVDGRFEWIVGRGSWVLWKAFHEVRVEIIDARAVKFTHADLPVILDSHAAASMLQPFTVESGHAGLWFRDGVFQEVLGPGTWAFWKGVGKLRLHEIDLKEQTIDIAGQEIMTSDKVTLRINALVTYRVVDPVLVVTATEDARQTLYRDAQLALRAVIGGRSLDELLEAKDAISAELTGLVRPRAGATGFEVSTVGIRDVILPGDMKELMNRVTEAKKAAEASLITRREETAAMRMQANTAKILEASPTLMKLRELEVLEKVAGTSNLTVVLGEGGLADRVVKLL